ncbi:PIF1 family DEAD/DEAH box helicase [Patescibacteria group bacterium]|nr:PIF1 family DEAD/DEAH box helicase [Patescibacteria group bacterium]
MTQEEAFDILKLGYNVYLTGAAGSGKTYLLNEYIGYLQKNGVEVGVTASTGIAATHLDGLTIHSWSGIGIKDKLEDDDISNILLKPYLQERFANTKVLVIDEISMLQASRLDMVNKICKVFKNSDAPFGGLQVILCGDFFQLPPVSKNSDDNSFVDKSQSWQEMDVKICYLEEQYRQEDSRFLQILNEIRQNDVSVESLRLLMSRLNKKLEAKITPTKLYTHNVDVDGLNYFELDKIKEESRAYEMTSWGEQTLVDNLKKGCLAPEKLILKKGALVMFVKNNFNQGYVNGTLGKIIGFDEEGFPVVKTTSGLKAVAKPASWKIEEKDVLKAEISQVPLRLAWAITIHKSQGMSLDLAEIDLSKSFAHGMGYVALSRVRSLSSMKLMGVNKIALQVDETVLESDQTLRNLSTQALIELRNLKPQDRLDKQKEFIENLRQVMYN